jgi:UDP-N-acetylglucosamine 2-epimerase (non-hydrolysing)
MRRYKITTIVGTRPELIRLSEVIKALDEITDHRLIHTGQNTSENMKDVFFSDLEIKKPDLEIEMMSDTLGRGLAQLFLKIEKEFLENRPDAVVILGDTNSGLSAIIARRMNIPIFHLEAGNRSFDPNVPEEVNRKIIDHVSDFNLVYTEQARRNLVFEGIHPRTICLIGSPMKEVILRNREQIEKSDILSRLGLEKSKYFVFSAHRQENVDDADRLQRMIQMVNELANSYLLPVFVSTHPRTRNRMKNLFLDTHPLVIWHDPIGFHDFCNLQLNSLITISDSGSISEEAAILGFKAITFRDSMERPEALEAGSILMSGINSESLLTATEFVLFKNKVIAAPFEYEISNSSQRTVNFLLSVLPNHKFWSGIR